MFCEKCGKKSKRNASFCGYCGERLITYKVPPVKKKYSPFVSELRRNFLLLIVPVFYIFWYFEGEFILQMFHCSMMTLHGLNSTVKGIAFMVFLGTLVYVASKRSYLFDLLYILPYLVIGVINVVIAHEEIDEMFCCICETVLPVVIVCAVVGVRTIFSKVKYEIILDILSLIVAKMLYKIFLITSFAVLTRLAASDLENFICDPAINMSVAFFFLCLIEYIIKLIKYIKKRTGGEKPSEIL